MSASSSSDCYLCGARNDPDASYCERCSGQLLRIPIEDDPEVENVSIDSIVDDITQPPDPEAEAEARARERPRVRGRKGSLQDQRLSDALGLADDGNTDIESGLVDTVVTSIPRATPSAHIPMIGTRAGAVPQSSMGSSDFGKRSIALLGLLLIATAWLGYSTLTGSDETPDSIAFTGTTVPINTTTTTEKPERVWRLNEVEGRFSFALVRLDLIRCPIDKDDETTIVETTGVNTSTNNVVFDGSPMSSADLAVIKSRTGARRIALIERTSDGMSIATTMTPTSRNLSRTAAETNLDTEPSFFVAYNPLTNVITTTTDQQDLPAQILVNSSGDAVAVLLGGQKIEADRLLAIDARVEIDPEDESKPKTDCEIAATLRYVNAPETFAADTPETTEAETTETEEADQ